MKEFIENIPNKLIEAFSGGRLVFTLLDIFLLTILLYAIFSFLSSKNCKRLIKYIVIGLAICIILGSEFNRAFGLKLMGELSVYLLAFVFLAIVLIFPQDIKRMLWKISSPSKDREVFSSQYDCSEEDLRTAVKDIVHAVQNMAKKDVGALIVIAPNAVPANIISSGTKLDAKLSSQLLECIFNTKAPLHDGAVFIRGNSVIAAGCFLPLTSRLDVDQELGTRHRAAIGICETNNVMVIIVSEETGVISVAARGAISRYYDSDMLSEKLLEVYGLKAVSDSEEKTRGKWRKRS